jgi:Ca2+-binding EF-hand superfamily protein
MLVVDPACRLSALEAYNHPWIQTNNIRDPIDQEVIKKLGEFELKNMLKRVILEYISVQVMTCSEKDNLIKEFNSIDLNGDGMLSKHELYRGTYLMQTSSLCSTIQRQQDQGPSHGR